MSKISPREWEALSAYLDGQLAQNERIRLEDRLHGNPHLQTALEDLRRTRTLLRSQPKIRAPRNFTLTPAMVKARPAPRAYPAIRLVSALASVLFVLVLVGDIFSAAPAVVPADTSIAMQRIETEALEPASEMMEMSQPEQAPALKAAPPETATEEPLTAESAPLLGAAEAVDATGVVPAEPAEALAAQDAQLDAEFRLNEEQAEIQMARPLFGRFDRTVLRVLEVLLAGLAVAAGLVAYHLRRRASA